MIYIHVPFCQRKCSYCAFYSVARPDRQEAYVEALLREIDARAAELPQAPETLYIGGGTPSLLLPDQWKRIFDRLAQHWPIDRCVEVTVEANPEQVDPQYLRDLSGLPINRWSLGLQSFDDSILRAMGRHHSAEQGRQAVWRLQEAGYEHLSIDLIYAWPGLSDACWQESLEHFFALDVDHLSAYALSVEPRTLLARRVQQGSCRLPEEDQQIRQFFLLQNALEAQGFEAYETSNYARHRKYAIHNCHYWDGTPYLGLGPAAHSFDGAHRRWNTSDIEAYIQAESTPFEQETLSAEDRYNEYVMTALRTQWGIDPQRIEKISSADFRTYFETELSRLNPDWIACNENGCWVTRGQGKLMVDALAADLFHRP